MEPTTSVNLSKWANVAAELQLSGDITPEFADDGKVYVVMTAGQAFSNKALVSAVVEKLYEEHGDDLVIVNQGRWQPDIEVLQVAKEILGDGHTRAVKPRHLVDRGLRAMLAGRQMTDAEQKEFGYVALTNEWAQRAIELHVFGMQQGPQFGWMRSFQQAGKVVLEWANPNNTEIVKQRTTEVPAYAG